MCQNTFPYGEFKTKSFGFQDYNAGVQNWDIIQNEDGYIYLANNEGILEYNGSTWNICKLNNQNHPRSFAKNDSGQIYVGGINEFGKIIYDEFGKPTVETLSQDIDSLNFGDIWKTHCIGDKVFFVSRNYIFKSQNNQIQTIEGPEEAEIINSIEVDGNLMLYAKSDTSSFCYFIDDQALNLVKNSAQISPLAYFNLANNQVLIDRDGNCFNLDKRGAEYKITRNNKVKIDLPENVSGSSLSYNDKMIAIPFRSGGVHLFDRDGKFVRALSKKEGLNDVATRKIIFDQYGNLWLASDNGLTFIETSSPVTTFNESAGITAGLTEDIAVFNDEIILANHTDLFKSCIKGGDLQFLNEGVFNMDVFDIERFKFRDGKEYFLIVANEGVYWMDDQFKRQDITGTDGYEIYAWNLFQSDTERNHIYVGLDGDGVGLIEYHQGKFIYHGTLKGTEGEVRDIAEQDGQIYYGVKEQGIFKLDTTKSQAENELAGLRTPSAGSKLYQDFTLELFNDKIYVGSSHGLYFIDSDKLVQVETAESKFTAENLLIHRLINDEDGKLWMAAFFNSGSDKEQSEFGFFEVKNGELSWSFKELSMLSEDVIFCIEKDRLGIHWLGGVDQVYAYNERTSTPIDLPFNVFINKVFLNEEDEFLFNTHYAADIDYVIPYENNSIKFDFSANAYLGGIKNEYSYFLEGEDDEWSKWKEKSEAVYQRLGEGDYIFHVKAKNYYGYESEERSFKFTISPPWYRTWWAYLFYLFLGVLLIYTLIRLSIRRVKKQNERLEQIVEDRTAEIAEQNATLEHQKAEIEEKTNDILDSIKYAERIQTAILPPQDELDRIFENENFVLYRPKDIVSGDFYWAERFGDEVIFSAVDCTGHGVPGAFVSIVGFNALNRTVNEFNLKKPGQILDKLTDLVVETFSKSESQIKDGMDIALCNLNYTSNKLTYAGANNPLIMVRNGELIEYKANKQPIGEFQNRVPFETHEIDLQKGDCFYIFSDGFADQFGGPKGKKFKTKNLKQLILDNNHLSMKDQMAKFQEEFDKWKGDFEQLDDVCLIGVRI